MKNFIWLASASPRRVQLLEQLGIAHRQIVPDTDETPVPDEAPDAFVQRVAVEKVRAGLALLRHPGPGRAFQDSPLVLGADTAVVRDEEIYGKPRDAGHAAQMLRCLAGRTHQVMTAVAMSDGKREAVRLSVSRVTFAPLDETTIQAYIAGGEPFGKAGAYAIQGRAAAFVSYLEGSYSGVMGLPLYETAALLKIFS